MTVAYSVIEAEQQLSASQDVIIISIGIPARPAILVSLQEEIAKEDRDFGKIERLLSGDVALTV